MTTIDFSELGPEGVTAEYVEGLDVLMSHLRWDWQQGGLSAEAIHRVLGGGTRIFVATDPETSRLAGTASLLTDYQLTGMNCIVHNVVTDPEYRGQGVAKGLMRLLLDSLPEEATKVELSSGNTRTAAHELYADLGFKPVDTTYFRLPIIRKNSSAPSLDSQQH